MFVAAVVETLLQVLDDGQHGGHLQVDQLQVLLPGKGICTAPGASPRSGAYLRVGCQLVGA